MRDELIQAHIPALRRYAWGLCQHAQDADDLVQDCLVRALSGWHRRRPEGSVRAWLFAILYNGFISDRRRAARWAIGRAAAEPRHVEPSQDHGLMLDDLDAALAALPEEQRAVLLLVAVEDFTYAETAEIVGVPVGTVMSRLSRGRERVRQTLDGTGRTETKIRRVQ